MSRQQLDAPAGTTLTAERPPPDLRRTWRVLLAVTAPLGAAAIAVSRVVTPYATTDDTASAVDAIAAHPTATQTNLWLGAVAMLFLLPGVVAVAFVTRRRTPRLTTWAVGISWLAFTAGIASPTTDSLLLAAVEEGVDPGSAVRIVEAMAAQPAAGALLGLFVVGHIVGTVLLGLALLRARVVPRWVAIGLMVSQPVHLVSFMTGLAALDLVAGWGLTTVGFAGASVALLRMRDDDFELPPMGVRAA